MGVSPEVATWLVVLFASIGRSEWIQLWAGLLGAIPAAVISAAVAAGVAVTILGRTNEHQQLLSDQARKEQRDTAARQMDAQLKLAEKQLIEQRELSEQQLAEQRGEAGRVRERAAIAEVVIANEGFAKASEGSFAEVRSQLAIMQSAAALWRIELGNGDMQEELLLWPHLLFVAAGNRSIARKKGDADEENAAWSILNDAIASFSPILIAWSGVDETARYMLRLRLREERKKLGEAIEEFAPGAMGGA